MVSFTHEQNIICCQTLLDGIAHEHTIIGRQLFAGHMVGSQPMKRKKKLLRIIMIINFDAHSISFLCSEIQPFKFRCLFLQKHNLSVYTSLEVSF